METGDIDPSRLSEMLKSVDFVDFLVKNEAISLLEMKETMGVACLSKDGKVLSQHNIESESTDSSAKSKKGINEIGNKCSDEEEQVWWHTHNNTLSALSSDDRLSGGDLKIILGTNIICAAGIEGYSCHLMNAVPPLVVHEKWSEQAFDKIVEKSGEGVYDLNEKWKLERNNMSDIYHMSCTGINGKGVKCSGIDWDTGFAEFEIGSADQVIVTGNVDTNIREDGFDILASSVGNKLRCYQIKSEEERKILYCR